ncbi:hypothetical protein F4776DRAFT_504398 [Hypoxylon sp. NC0597]|nr:hypothetical protein F4776DRAFT_504398 [Hypoxylon sp. NC0597]
MLSRLGAWNHTFLTLLVTCLISEAAIVCRLQILRVENPVSALPQAKQLSKSHAWISFQTCPLPSPHHTAPKAVSKAGISMRTYAQPALNAAMLMLNR